VKGDSSVFQSNFNGSDLVRQYLISNLEKMRELLNMAPNIRFSIQYQLFSLKKVFLENISKDTQYCNCKSLDETNIFPGMYDIVQKECSRLCGRNALEFDDETLEE
jgi:hypothetical protein